MSIESFYHMRMFHEKGKQTLSDNVNSRAPYLFRYGGNIDYQASTESDTKRFVLPGPTLVSETVAFWNVWIQIISIWAYFRAGKGHRLSEYSILLVQC